MSATGRYFPLLDAIRGLAALVVLLRHTGYLWDGLVLPHSYLAVDLFFVLSGVVVANAYEQPLRAGLSPGRFWLLRMIRIYPLYALGSLLGLVPVLAAVAGLTAQPVQGSLLLALGSAALLLPDLADGSLFPLNPPAWSLFFELAANLLYALLLRHLNARMLWLIVLGSAAGLALVLYANPAAGLHGGYTPDTLLTGTLRVSFGFFAGVLLWRAWMARAALGRRLPAAVGWSAVIAAAALLLARAPGALGAGYDLFAVLVLFPILVWVAMHAGAGAGPGARVCAWLGALSYPLYVLHVPAARLLNGTLEKGLHLAVADWYPYVGVGLLALLLPACLLIERHVDAPLRARLLRRLKGQASRGAAAAGGEVLTPPRRV